MPKIPENQHIVDLVTDQTAALLPLAMNPYAERVFWLGKFQARQEVCCWFRDFEGKIVISQITEGVT